MCRGREGYLGKGLMVTDVSGKRRIRGREGLGKGLMVTDVSGKRRILR